MQHFWCTFTLGFGCFCHFVFVCLLLFVSLFWESVCSPGCSGTFYVDQDGFKFTQTYLCLPSTIAKVLGLNYHHAWNTICTNQLKNLFFRNDRIDQIIFIWSLDYVMDHQFYFIVKNDFFDVVAYFLKILLVSKEQFKNSLFVHLFILFKF